MKVQERVIKVVGEQLGHPQGDVKMENKITDDLGADSLDMIELTMAIEDEFEMEIPDTDAERIKTVQDIVDYVVKQRPELATEA